MTIHFSPRYPTDPAGTLCAPTSGSIRHAAGGARSRGRALSAAVLAAWLLVACGGGTSGVAEAPPPQRPASIERDVSPVAIDPRVDTATQDHVAINPSPDIEPAGKLFVFLPGTGGVPNLYRLILREGARQGFHTLALNYPNDDAVGVLCTASTNQDCYWDVRREIITGNNLSALVSVNGPNSIVTRTAKALAYLNTTYPDEGWGQFLDAGGDVDWSKVVLSGHSQGGGHAGVMSKMYALHRACYFASPPDWSGYFDAPATWTDRANVTAASRQFGISHVDDPLVPLSTLEVIWGNLGLDAFGSKVLVDNSNPPYNSSHVLVTEAVPKAGGLSASPLHGVTVLDDSTPDDGSGKPLFAPEWRYMCFQ